MYGSGVILTVICMFRVGICRLGRGGKILKVLTQYLKIEECSEVLYTKENEKRTILPPYPNTVSYKKRQNSRQVSAFRSPRRSEHCKLHEETE